MKKNVLALIEARMGSSRLKGKVLKKLGKTTVLDLLVKRVKKAHNIDKVVVITSEPFGKLREASPKRLADEPEFTIKPYFLPNTFEIFFSNSFTEGPSIKLIDLFFNTSSDAAISSLP
mgnify:CR=1 FL=1